SASTTISAISPRPARSAIHRSPAARPARPSSTPRWRRLTPSSTTSATGAFRRPEMLRIGVIGLGFFGSRHARIYAAHPAAELVAVCDRDAAARSRVGDHFGVAAYADYQQLLHHPGIDAVSICLPDRLHEEAALAAAAAGKAILLEKPLAHCT